MKREGLEAIDHAIIGDIWASNEVWQNLVTLCDGIGTRFAGTPGERKAVDFLLQKGEEYGLENVHMEEFEYGGWTRGEPAKLELLSPERGEVPCVSLPRCPTGEVVGEVVSVGYGLMEDFQERRGELQGKVVMIMAGTPAYYGRGIHRQEKLGRAVQAGAVGILWQNNERGYLLPTGSLSRMRAFDVPCVGITNEEGALLGRMARRGPVTVRIITHDLNHPAMSWNVVAEIPGASHPGEVIVAGAHYDCHDISPGAMDNGSGTVAVLEAARALAKYKGQIGKTLRFVWFSVEEMGLQGSRNYVLAHREELDQIEFMLNLDSVGSDTLGRGLSLQGSPDLIPHFREIAQAMEDPFPMIDSLGVHSDHYPFFREGVPVGTIAALEGGRGAQGWTRGFGHTPADTLDKVSPRGLRFSALLLARILWHLANGDDWPGRRRSPREVMAILEERGFRRELEVQEAWPPANGGD